MKMYPLWYHPNPFQNAPRSWNERTEQQRHLIRQKLRNFPKNRFSAKSYTFRINHTNIGYSHNVFWKSRHIQAVASEDATVGWEAFLNGFLCCVNWVLLMLYALFSWWQWLGLDPRRESFTFLLCKTAHSRIIRKLNQVSHDIFGSFVKFYLSEITWWKLTTLNKINGVKQAYAFVQKWYGFRK